MLNTNSVFYRIPFTHERKFLTYISNNGRDEAKASLFISNRKKNLRDRLLEKGERVGEVIDKRHQETRKHERKFPPEE